MSRADEWIRELGMRPHPEGGSFVESYRAPGTIPAEALPEGFAGGRPHATAIYFLLRSGERSHLHRLLSDELWHHYEGSALTLHLIQTDGVYERLSLGTDRTQGERPQILTPAGCWFGATVDDPDGYALVGCTVSPGFDFADFELGDRRRLLERFPRHRALIESLTR